MRLRARLKALDDSLHAFHELWHPQPFREAQPAWCTRWPALTAELLALSDDQATYLNNDVDAALAWLAQHIPDVAGIAPLFSLPQRPRQALGEHGIRWAWEIPGRKRSQIEAFAESIQPGGDAVVDWCGGKGHLGRLLGVAWGQTVHTLEIDPALCAAGAALAGRLTVDHKFWQKDALTVEDWPQSGQHAVALHACGELHRVLLARGCAVGVRRFDIAPCCYHRGVASVYQPLSNGLRLRPSRDDTRLAVTETVTASPRLARQRDHEMAWKLAFDAWRRQLGENAYRNFKPVPAAWFRDDFSSFLNRMAARENLPLPSSAVANEIEATGWHRQREVMRLSIPRHAFRRALEVWLVSDLAATLEEQGYAVELGQFCPRELTPRNLMLSAVRL